MCPWVGPHAPSFGRQLWGLPSRVEYLSPQGVLLPLVYGTTASPLWFELRGHSAWQVTPSWTVYRLACHRLLPWLRVTFALVPDAAWPGSDQWPWSTAPATGPVGRLGRPSASDPWGIGSFLSLGRPTCVQCPGLLGSCSPVCPRGLLCCVCGVLGHLALVHRCSCCVRCARAMGGCVPLPPPLIFVFFLKEKEKQGHAYTAGTDTGSWCGGATVLCPLACVVGAVAAVAPQGCGSRVLMYTGLGQGGFGEVSLCFWSWLVRRLCGLWVWAVVTLFPRRAWFRSQGLAVLGCGSGLICVWVLARLGGCDGSGPGFGAFGRSGARCCVRWRPSASGSFGGFSGGPGVAPRGGGLLGNGVSWRRRWPGGQARRVVWCAGLLGCCGCRRCRCADVCGVVRGCACAGLGFG